MTTIFEDHEYRHGERHERHLIGWAESVDFPEWEIDGVQAKVDTGARTSALHVENLEELARGRVRFEVVLSRRNSDKRVSVTTRPTRWARVRSSTGVYQRRCFVKTRMRLGPVEKEIEISLVSREKMIFRMLLGRKALERDFVVDVSKRRVLSPRRKKKKKARSARPAAKTKSPARKKAPPKKKSETTARRRVAR